MPLCYSMRGIVKEALREALLVERWLFKNKAIADADKAKKLPAQHFFFLLDQPTLRAWAKKPHFPPTKADSHYRDLLTGIIIPVNLSL